MRDFGDDLRPYERQQGGYWLYGPGCDVYGNGRTWVPAKEHERRMQDFQNAGEPYRRALGIDGTAGDAQDVPHPYIQTPGEPGCVVCGLRESLAQHHVPGIPTAAEVGRRVAAVVMAR